MHGITFDFCDLHRHGSAFVDFLALRKKMFVDTLGWDVPHNERLEMDQYDTPLAHYSVAVMDGQVVCREEWPQGRREGVFRRAFRARMDALGID